jgi:hypothetical protein
VALVKWVCVSVLGLALGAAVDGILLRMTRPEVLEEEMRRALEKRKERD